MNFTKIISVLWRYEGPSAWYFITLPSELSSDIKVTYSNLSPGWGSLPVTVTIGKTTWKTSIFYDTKRTAYLLPVKAEIRKKEKLQEGDKVEMVLEVN